MDISIEHAAHMHENVPPDWYHRSIRVNALQRFWHNNRFKVVKEMIEPTGGRILDIGCADGVFTNVILKKSKAKEIIGIDVLKSSVDWANKHWKSKKLKFRVGNAHDLKFKDGSFDAVFALEVLEHVPNPQKVFSQIKRVLKKGGYVVVLVPSDNALFKFIWFFWTKLGPGRIWNHTHVQSFNSSNTLSDNLEKSGFTVTEDNKFLLGMLNAVKARKN